MEVIQPRLSEEDVFYPETDGKPMAESDFQREPLMYLVAALRLYFEPMDDVYVSGNMLLYYEEGNPRACVAPDVFVVCEVEKHDRNIYKTWESGKAPDVVIEITSKSTHREDEIRKADLYRKLGVSEYFQYDPTGDYIKNRLKGRRLVNGQWTNIPGIILPGMRRSLESYDLSLVFCVDRENEIHVWCPDGRRFLKNMREYDTALYEAEQEVRNQQDEIQTFKQEALEYKNKARDEQKARIAAQKAAAAEENRRLEAEQRIKELESLLNKSS